MTVRDGEEDKNWFRSDRVFTAQDKYYFTTREGVDIGPFDSREAAGNGLKNFVEAVIAGRSLKEAESAALYGAWSSSRFY